MKKISAFAAVVIWFLFTSMQTFAQFNTPNVDGTVAAGEYGVHSDGQNQKSTSTAQNWFLTWDDANLYVALTNANLAEGAVLYLDRNPLSPANGGTNANGNLTGVNYDGTNFSALPFRADFVAYFKNAYREYRTADGTGGWSAQTAAFGNYASGTGNVRELSIPWTAINPAGRPAAFNFFIYATSPGGYVYAQVPQGNAGGVIGTAAVYSKYYSVVNTENGTSTRPFSLEQTATAGNIDYAGLKHDSFDGYYRSPFGAVTTGTAVNLKFRTKPNNVTGVFLKVYKYNPATSTTDAPQEYPLAFLENRMENGIAYEIYSINYTAPPDTSIIYYKFRVTDASAQAFYGDDFTDDHDNLGQGGTGAASAGEPFAAFQMTVYPPTFTTPGWIQNAAVYHIFPDRFRNGDITNDWCRAGNTTGCPSLYGASPSSNIAFAVWNSQVCDPRQATPCPNNYGSQFFGGDLKGIEQKLDYIKNLGFDAIYLNPIFKARSNHRYDTDDFLGIAPELGGDAAFISLVNAANTRGMRIILDGVFNHMSQDSEYFDYFRRIPGSGGACESLASPYRSWFNFFNNNVPCTTADYEGWFGFGGLPVFNESNAVKDFFYRTPTTNVTQYWYNRGAGGWRFDVATDISHQWWNEYRAYAKIYKPDGVLIGEIFPDASQYLAGDQLDGSMNYRFRKNVLGFARALDWEDNDNNGANRIVGLTPSQFDRAMTAIREDYPLPAQLAMLNLLDSHDTNRALYTLTIAGDGGLMRAKERLKLASVFQFTYLGAPMVYYGDEAGLNAPSLGNSGGGLPEDDPYNRAPYPWADEAGNPNIYGPADTTLINFYTALGKIRRDHPALRTGAYKTLLTGDTTAASTDNNTIVFARSSGADKLVVALNNGAVSNTVTIPVAEFFADGTALSNLLGSATYTVSGGNVAVTLPARSAAILARRTIKAPFDFDGDGKTDVSVFRPADGSWWYSRSSDNSFRVYSFGDSNDRLAPGDWTGDGKTDIAVWRPSTGEWFVQRSDDNSYFSFPFGALGDIPAPADYDGDGRTDAAVFRPSIATWFILNSSGSGTSIVQFGAGSDKPVPADYDGDGKTDVAIFRPADGSWWYLQSSDAQFRVYSFGNSSDKAVPGDWTGDGRADIAIFRPSSGEWFIQRSEDGSFFSFPFGASGDIPAAGDYDGDGRTDAGVFRPSNLTWFVNRSTDGVLIQSFGAAGDVPVPSVVVP